MAFTLPVTTAVNAARTAGQVAQKSGLEKVLDILGSPGGQTAVGALGAGLSAYGAGKQAEADRAQNAQQFEANMAQRQLENQQADQRNRAAGAIDASPLGAEQGFAQKQAIAKAILGGAQNFSVTPGDPRVAAAMGKSTGGIQLPEGGLDPAMLERLFGDLATQQSLATHGKRVAQLNPQGPAFNLSDLYGDSEGQQNPFQRDVQTFQQSELDRQAADSARQRAIIQRAIDEDIRGAKQQKSGGGGGIGGFLKALVPTAASFIPGVGPFAAAGSAALLNR